MFLHLFTLCFVFDDSVSSKKASVEEYSDLWDDYSTGEDEGSL